MNCCICNKKASAKFVTSWLVIGQLEKVISVEERYVCLKTECYKKVEELSKANCKSLESVK